MNNNTICFITDDNIDMIDKLLLHHKHTYCPEGVLITSIPDNIDLYFIPKSRASEISYAAGSDDISHETLVDLNFVCEIHKNDNGIKYTFFYDKNGSRHSVSTTLPVSEYENMIDRFYDLKESGTL